MIDSSISSMGVPVFLSIITGLIYLVLFCSKNKKEPPNKVKGNDKEEYTWVQLDHAPITQRRQSAILTEQQKRIEQQKISPSPRGSFSPSDQDPPSHKSIHNKSANDGKVAPPFLGVSPQIAKETLPKANSYEEVNKKIKDASKVSPISSKETLKPAKIVYGHDYDTVKIGNELLSDNDSSYKRDPKQRQSCDCLKKKSKAKIAKKKKKSKNRLSRSKIAKSSKPTQRCSTSAMIVNLEKKKSVGQEM